LESAPETPPERTRGTRSGPLLVDAQPTKRKRAESLDERPTEAHEEKQNLRSTVVFEPGQIKANDPKFSSLETELHDLIFEELGIKDVLSLSLTNRYFWSVGRRHIQTYFMSFLGPWTGESIICVGDYVEAGDHPPGLFTEDERSELQQLLDEEGQPMMLLDYTHEYTEIDVSLPTTLLRQLLSKDYCKHYYGMSDSDRSEIIETVRPESSQFYPGDVPWILRNLTTQEYVRSDVIALKPEHIHGPNIEFLGFGEVVLSRICWSSDPSVNMAYNGNIHRGVWAGHRFDITTRARHEQDVKEEWKDVSEEVAREIASIWESEYGGDWRRIIMGEKCDP
jgi:hypothetical protein